MKQFFLTILNLLDKVEAFIRRYTAIIISILVIFLVGIADSFYRVNSDINDNLQSIDDNINDKLRNIDSTLDSIERAIKWNSRS